MMAPRRHKGSPAFLVDGEALRREARRMGHPTDVSIALASGLPQSTLSRVMTGKALPTARTLAALAVFLGPVRYKRVVKLGKAP